MAQDSPAIVLLLRVIEPADRVAGDRRTVKTLPRRGGRPSREAAALLQDRILDTATELFLAEGYGETTIELVSKRARISKRTFYHRFPDKAALFGAVVHRIVGRLRPPAVSDLFVGNSLEETLTRLARAILRAALAPQALALHRVILAEAGRFPALAAVVADRPASQEAIERIAELLQREATAKRIALDAPQFAATQFLQMVVALPQRRALGLGVPMTPAELDAWARQTTNLFVNGCRGWSKRVK
jgi:TetR/AcrR family transcriptional regulator, mexJK operon transcriptional repressor